MQVWDKFLTERDKKHLALAGAKKEPFGFGIRPALLIIDDFYMALGDRPLPILESVKTWPFSCGAEGWEAVHKTKELLEVARENSILVVYSTNIDNFPSPWGNLKKRAHEIPEWQREIQFNIVKELVPRQGELVVRKSAPSAFFGTPLALHLISNRIDTLITCGESTSGCVRATVVDGCSYRIRMGVVEECTFDRHEASHALNLFDMNQKYADVVSLSEAKAYLEMLGRSPRGLGREAAAH